MNDYMISKWNKPVTNDDTVYCLGDFGFGNFDMVKNVFNQLNGTKILIMGNHDFKRSIGWWYKIGFSQVNNKPIVFDDACIMSHKPLINNKLLNIHGHIHNSGYNQEFEYKNHVNVSVEVIDYLPQNLDILLKKKLGKKV